jgi:predicted NBD/HSP70 family sugar kinase
MNSSKILSAIKLKITPELHPEFIPAVLANIEYEKRVNETKDAVAVKICVIRSNQSRTTIETKVFPKGREFEQENLWYIERLVKSMLWIYGGHKIIFGGPKELGMYIKKLYSKKGRQKFDYDMMTTAYDKPLSVEITTYEKVPDTKEVTQAIGRHLDGCRIGFDLGASDRKVSAVINGKPVFSEEVIWQPREHTNWRYHYHEIMSALHRAAAHMPRVDAIGGSSAGIWVNNKVKVASLFRGIPKKDFKEISNIILKIQKYWKVPIVVVNDGEVTALAASMSLNINSVLGIALGSSEAAGFVNEKGNITDWLNELAFVPVDFNPSAPVDEWSGDYGCGVQYFSQQAVFRLAPKVGIDIPQDLTLAEKLKHVQEFLAKNDPRAIKIWETIGIYMGYGIAYYHKFYNMKHVLILGRVTSGQGGELILNKAKEVLSTEFPELAKKIELHLPDEKSRRVGQSIAAASLPIIKKRKK